MRGCLHRFWAAYAAVPQASDIERAVGKETGKTSYVERFNNTLRQRVSRLVRKTLSFQVVGESHWCHLVFRPLLQCIIIALTNHFQEGPATFVTEDSGERRGARHLIDQDQRFRRTVHPTHLVGRASPQLIPAARHITKKNDDKQAGIGLLDRPTPPTTSCRCE